MRNLNILACGLLGGVLCCTCQPALGQSTDQPGHAPAQPAAKRQGFFDYALGKINAQEKHYGASMEVQRTGMVEHTVDDLYFWSNVVTLLLLCGVSGVVLFQWRSADKREVIAASLIAQLWNGRVSDRIEIERRTEQFNRLVETHNAEVERGLSQVPSPAEKEAESAGKLTRNVRSLTENAPRKPKPEAPSDTVVADADGMAVNFQQTNLLLQRRVEALQNSEQNLKQRLNQATVLLDQERRRNATLKGA